MSQEIQQIPLFNLALSLIPLGITFIVMVKWSTGWKSLGVATFRMLFQLSLVGFFLNFIFENESGLILCVLLALMLAFASWISLSPIKKRRKNLFFPALIGLGIGSTLTLLIVVFGTLQLNDFVQPEKVIPLAGMILSNSMNSISLAAERYLKELELGIEPLLARKEAYQTALIPLTNSFLSVGLVGFPGMMTGQILSGVDPLIAARYQIMVMAMVFGAAGIGTFLFLQLISKEKSINVTSD